MYVAEFEDGRNTVLQLLICFPVLGIGPTAAADAWSEQLKEAGKVVATTEGVEFTVRLCVQKNRFARYLFLNSTGANRRVLECLSKEFLRLNVFKDALVTLCPSRTEFDAANDGLPTNCLHIHHEPLLLDGCKLVEDFRLLPSFATIGSASLDEQGAVCWQGAFRTFEPRGEELRTIRRNLIQLEQNRNIPQILVGHQTRVVQRFESTRFLLEESLWVDDVVERRSLQTLSRLHREHFGRLGFADSPVETSSGTEAELSRAALHPALFRALSPFETLATAVSLQEALASLIWRPPSTWTDGVLSNTVKLADKPEDFLQRIEAQLQRLEEELLHRRAAAQECVEMRKAINISREDPPFGLVKARQILEMIVENLFRRHRPSRALKPLLNMIEDLTGQTGERAALPRHIGSYLHTIRVLGNLEVHRGLASDKKPNEQPPLNLGDVELSLLMILNVIEWFLLEQSSVRSSELEKP
jgi:hypothetical protein